MQSGKRLTLKDYFAKHTRTHKNHKNIQMLNCYCQLSSSVIFRQYGVSQSECKIDRPRPGLSRLSPRPHTKALGTRLLIMYTYTFQFVGTIGKPHNADCLMPQYFYICKYSFLCDVYHVSHQI
jgi:hypothetical protein